MKNILVLGCSFFLWSLLLGVNVYGQDPLTKGRTVFVTGMIYDSQTEEPLSNTSFSINGKHIFASNELGRFSFFANPGDSVLFSYIGYYPNRLVVPDTLTSNEYVMGVFMHSETIRLGEIIILPRAENSSIIVNRVVSQQEAKRIAQRNVDKAVYEGLTQPATQSDAIGNAKRTMRINQIRLENKGMLATPENSVSLSTRSYMGNSIIFGSPISTPNRVEKEMISNSEVEILLYHFNSIKDSLANIINDPFRIP